MNHKGYILVIAVMATIIILQKECGQKSDCPEISLKSSEVIYPRPQFRVINTPQQAPKILYKDSIVEIPADVDTACILFDYFSKNFYSDTIQDSLFTLVISDTVTQNKIAYRGISYMDLKPTIINTYEVAKRKNKWFLGGTIGGSRNTFDAGASILLVNKKDNAYNYTYQAISGTHNVGVYWKIGKK